MKAYRVYGSFDVTINVIEKEIIEKDIVEIVKNGSHQSPTENIKISVEHIIPMG